MTENMQNMISLQIRQNDICTSILFPPVVFLDNTFLAHFWSPLTFQSCISSLLVFYRVFLSMVFLFIVQFLELIHFFAQHNQLVWSSFS